MWPPRDNFSLMNSSLTITQSCHFPLRLLGWCIIGVLFLPSQAPQGPPGPSRTLPLSSPVRTPATPQTDSVSPVVQLLGLKGGFHLVIAHQLPSELTTCAEPTPCGRTCWPRRPSSACIPRSSSVASRRPSCWSASTSHSPVGRDGCPPCCFIPTHRLDLHTRRLPKLRHICVMRS